MPKLIYMKGLPGSGKTTKARTDYPDYYRVNKDDIRAMLYGDAKFTRERERNVVNTERRIVMGLVKDRQNIVVDNTGFNIAHENFYRCLTSEEILKEGQSRYNFVLDDLSHVPLHKCLQRNTQRTGKTRVPDKVIHDMWAKYVQPRLAYPQDPSLPPCIIVDVDGTVAKMVNRGPFEWDKVGEDEPREEVIAAVNGFRTSWHLLTGKDPDTFYFSGRDSVCYPDTLDWLIKWVVSDDLLYLHMRPYGDSRPDYIVKRELWEQHIKDKYRVVAVFDDRPSVLRLWRELGFTTFDVGPGVEF